MRSVLWLCLLPACVPTEIAGQRRAELTATSYLVLGRELVDPATGLPTGVYEDPGPAVLAAGGTIEAYLGEIGAVSASATSSDFSATVALDSRVSGAIGAFDLSEPGANDSVVFDGAFGPWSPFSNGLPALVSPTNPQGYTDAQLADLNSADLEPYQWELRALHVDRAWSKGVTGKGVRIAVLDGRVDPQLPDLLGATPEQNAIDEVKSLSTYDPAVIACFNNQDTAARNACLDNLDPNRPFARDWVGGTRADFHAFGCIGLIAARRNGVGPTGVAPDSQIISIRVNSGGVSPFVKIAQALLYAAGRVDIISSSQVGSMPTHGGCTSPDRCFTAEQARTAIETFTRVTGYLRSRGTLFVAAGGNDGMLLDPEVMRFLPSDAPRVIGVGATGPNGSASDPTTSPYRYSFSNQGIQLISFVAPGGYRYQKPPLRLVGRACASNTDCSDPDYAATCETNPANGRKSCQIACTSDDTCLGPNRSFSGLACSAITQAVLGKSTCQVTICPMGGTSAHFRCFALDQPFSLQPTEQRLKPTLFSGTSAAAPVLAGFLALLKQKYPTLTPDQLVKKLKDASIDLGDKGRDPVFGYGHPDAARISW